MDNSSEDTLALELQTYDDLETDSESLVSLETDDGYDHEPEKILAEQDLVPNDPIYLVKWQDCSVLRSSWEPAFVVKQYLSLWENWQIEKQRIVKGESTPFDLGAFQRALEHEEILLRQRRILRRLKRLTKRVISIIST